MDKEKRRLRDGVGLDRNIVRDIGERNISRERREIYQEKEGIGIYREEGEKYIKRKYRKIRV
jgi:hypothetical protein